MPNRQGWALMHGRPTGVGRNERCEKPRERKCRDAAYARKKNDGYLLPAACLPVADEIERRVSMGSRIGNALAFYHLPKQAIELRIIYSIGFGEIETE